ncbi:hypothetical protein LMH73_023010 [Vibrio splendidus]|nr:hypothetical protein [Vibrio splendidus]MCC4883026.1 hypothetical protein [Vibrio splendidus]
MQNRQAKQQAIIIQSSYVKGLSRALNVNEKNLSLIRDAAINAEQGARYEFDFCKLQHSKTLGASMLASELSSSHLKQELNREHTVLKEMKASFKAEFGELIYSEMISLKERISQAKALAISRTNHERKKRTDTLGRILMVLVSRRFRSELSQHFALPIAVSSELKSLDSKISSVRNMVDSHPYVATPSIVIEQQAISIAAAKHAGSIISIADYLNGIARITACTETIANNKKMANYFDIIRLNTVKLSNLSNSDETDV